MRNYDKISWHSEERKAYYQKVNNSTQKKVGGAGEQQYVSHYTLIMRKQGDHRKDTIYKEEVYHAQIENDFDVVAVFEDRDQTTKMWRDLGLLTCQVYYGNF